MSTLTYDDNRHLFFITSYHFYFLLFALKHLKNVSILLYCFIFMGTNNRILKFYAEKLFFLRKSTKIINS